MGDFQFVKDRIKASADVKHQLLSNDAAIKQIIDQSAMITEKLRLGHRLFLCGNGGSAADAQHIAAELSGRFFKERPPLPVEALHVNSSLLTAVANDYDYNHVYSRALQAHGRPGDVLIVISTSGRSSNIVEAAARALEMGISVWGWTGSHGGQLDKMGFPLLKVPSNITPRIQECHILIGHILCEYIENTLFP
jgi:D-sedoheptulose 7-phosphate isomerase